MRREPRLEDAGGVVARAADEAVAVGQQHQMDARDNSHPRTNLDAYRFSDDVQLCTASNNLERARGRSEGAGRHPC